MSTAPHTNPPARAFLDWPVITDPDRWAADIALIGILHSEPYAGDVILNDQTRAPDAIRLASGQFSDGPTHWDFDIGSELASVLPARCVDCGNLAWSEGRFDEYSHRVTEAIRRLWRGGAQIYTLGGDPAGAGRFTVPPTGPAPARRGPRASDRRHGSCRGRAEL